MRYSAKAVVATLAAGLGILLLREAGYGETIRLNLEGCLKRALEQSPRLVESRWDLFLAESRVSEAGAGYYPRGKVTSLTGLVPRARGQVFEPPIDTVSKKGNLGPFTRVEVEFAQPLFTWGKLAAGRRAATKGLEQEQAKRQQTRDEVIVEVKKLYYELLLARQIAELLGDVRSNFEKAIEIAEKRLAANEGTVTQSDVLKLKIGLAGIAKEIGKTQNGAELARQALARQIGLTDADDFDVVDARLEPAAATFKPLEEYMRLVFERSPEWKQLLAGIEAREAQVRVEASDLYPSVFLAGGFKYAYAPGRDRQLSPFAKDDYNLLELPGAALGLYWPLSFAETRAKVQAAKAELEKLRAQKRSAETGIRLAVRKAYLEAVQTREAMEIADSGRKSARGLLVTSVSSFELGVGEAKDVFESLVVYTRSTSDYYEAVSDYNLALARLSQAVGEEVTELTY